MYSVVPLSSKTNISKFQFDLDVKHFSNEPLARMIAQALSVLDVKFTFTIFANTSKFVKNTPLRVVFSTLSSVFGNMVKHDLSCLIDY